MKNEAFPVTCEVGERKETITASYSAFETLEDAVKHYSVRTVVKNGVETEEKLSGHEAQKRLVDDLNDTRKRTAYSKAYADLKVKLEGPDKAIERIASTLVKNAEKFGRSMTLESAIALIKTNPDILTVFGLQATAVEDAA